MSTPVLTGLPPITDLASAAAALDERHAQLIDQEADLLNQADNAVSAALATPYSDQKRALLTRARALYNLAQAVRSDIGLIESCWVPA